MNTLDTKNLKAGFGVAFDWFGGKTIFSAKDYFLMLDDESVRKIYFNMDGASIRRVK